MTAPPRVRPSAALAGLHIAVTRATGKGEALAAQLRAHGAAVHDIPLTRIDRRDPGPLQQALREVLRARRGPWILLTSATAVELLAEAANATGLHDALADSWFAIVGEVTAQAAERHGWRADIVPSQFRAEALLDAMAEHSGVAGTVVLYPAAAGARDVLPDGLSALGASVQVVPCYESVPDTDGQAALASLLAAGDLDLVTVAAPSAVDALSHAIPPERAGGVAVACIGPITAKAARHAGFRVVVEADPYTADGLVRSIVAARERLR